MFKIIRICLLALPLLMTACAAPPKTESMGEYLDSSAVTANVKARFVDQLGRAAFSIQVKTYKNKVQLSGFVNSATIKQRAGTIAASTVGVHGVQNDLIVK